jgi:hypothetical protein
VGTIASGQTKPGTILTGEIDTYTFAAKAGDSLVVSMGDEDPWNPRYPLLELYGPDGAPLASGQGDESARVSVRAPVSGTYSVLASLRLEESSDYTISLAKVPSTTQAVDSNGDGGAMKSGETRSGTISTGELDVYTFAATAGNSLVVSMGEEDPWNPRYPLLELYGPDGKRLASGEGDNSTRVSVGAPASGTYTVVTSLRFGKYSDYNVTMVGAVTPPPSRVVSITATDATASEPGSDTGTFTIRRTGTLDAALTVNFTLGGSAIKGTDYGTISSSVTIPANASSATVRVTPKDDALAEPTESVILTLASSTAYSIDSTKRSATVNILDNDPVNKPAISIAATDGTASESAVGPTSSGAFTLSRSKATTAPLVISLGIGGSATLNSDYRLQVYGATASVNTTTKTLTLTIAPGTGPVRIIVEVLNDSAGESAEQVTLSLKSGSGYVVNTAKAGATVSIADKSAT